MNELPRISIVTPSLNQGRYLGMTILSVLWQNYPNLQYGIVDGGSTDESREVIERYRTRLSYVIIEPDRGQAEAINKGLRRADGEIVGWLCSDDTLLPGALHTVGRYFAEHPECHWLAGGVYSIDADNHPLEEQQPRGDFSLAGILLRPNGLLIPQPGVFWRRRLLEEVGFLDESLHYAMDFDLWCRFAAAGYRPHLLNVPLATYRMHAASKSCTAQVEFLREHIVIESRMAKQLPWKLWLKMKRRLGYQKRSLAIQTQGKKLWRSVVLRPWWLGSQQIRQALWAAKAG